MRSLAELVEQPGSEHGEEEGDPENRANCVQPGAEQTAGDDPSGDHQRQAEPAGERALVVSERQQQTGDAADQGRARFPAQNADQDR